MNQSTERQLEEIRTEAGDDSATVGPLSNIRRRHMTQVKVLLSVLDAEQVKHDAVMEEVHQLNLKLISINAHNSNDLGEAQSKIKRLEALVRDCMTWMHDDESRINLADLEERASQELEKKVQVD